MPVSEGQEKENEQSKSDDKTVSELKETKKECSQGCIENSVGATNEEIQKNELTTLTEEDSVMTDGQSEQAKESLNLYTNDGTSKEQKKVIDLADERDLCQ